MKKILCCVFTLLLVFCTPVNVWAIQEVHHAVSSSALSKKPVGEIKIAFVFDGPSDKNKEVLETFKNTISKSLLPDYKAVFDDKLVFVGNWSESSAITASNKAMNSQAFMVISLGYMSSVYLDGRIQRYALGTGVCFGTDQPCCCKGYWLRSLPSPDDHGK